MKYSDTESATLELKWQARGKSYDSMPVYHAKEEDLDAAKIKGKQRDTASTRNKNLTFHFLYHFSCCVIQQVLQ